MGLVGRAKPRVVCIHHHARDQRHDRPIKPVVPKEIVQGLLDEVTGFALRLRDTDIQRKVVRLAARGLGADQDMSHLRAIAMGDDQGVPAPNQFNDPRERRAKSGRLLLDAP